ncbi:hypothetical protein LJC31_00655 [Synergistaceae bacterium OttesenSCG-928-I11]|nr:hypothetical protein [Synergistaceae bacterium OttesenSCG-928-I11]
MKKYLILAALVVLACASAAGAGDFRNVEWGMSMREVMAAETVPLEEDDESDVPEISCLFGETTVFGFDCELIYFFANGELKQARYFFFHETQNPNSLISHYEKLDRLLMEKYAYPLTREDFMEPDYTGDRGTGLVTGKGWMFSEWLLPDGATIEHELSGDNNEPYHCIDYYAPGGRDLLDEIEERNAKKML